MSNIYTSSRGDSHYSEIIMMHQLCAVGFGFGVFFGGGFVSMVFGTRGYTKKYKTPELVTVLMWAPCQLL